MRRGLKRGLPNGRIPGRGEYHGAAVSTGVPAGRGVGGAEWCADTRVVRLNHARGSTRRWSHGSPAMRAKLE